MSTSWVDIDDRGFWADDVDLEILLYFISKYLTANVSAPWAQRYADELYIKATAGMIGCISPNFSRLDADQLDVVYAATLHFIEQLANGDVSLTAEFLNGLGLHGGGVSFQHTLPSEYVLEVAHALIALIDQSRRPDEAQA